MKNFLDRMLIMGIPLVLGIYILLIIWGEEISWESQEEVNQNLIAGLCWLSFYWSIITLSSLLNWTVFV